MKLAITTSGTALTDPLDNRFGRAKAFLLIDTESDEVELIDNAQNLNAAQGAGIQAAETVVNAGAEALITGHTGPKAFRVLLAADVDVYNTDAKTAAEALQLFKDGKLQKANAADVPGHWM